MLYCPVVVLLVHTFAGEVFVMIGCLKTLDGLTWA